MIFVDTGVWIAITDASDQYHRRAVKMYSLLKKQRKRFVTIFQKALTVFRRYDTIDLSLTDCVSFMICQQLEIPYAFSFDKHFPIMGISLYALP
jgi:predicted nucleic acid-binding protein